MGTRVVVGVCGGIAAYKAVEIVRRLTRDGHEVRVVMTDHAQQFIAPLTFATLSGHRVYTSQFSPPTQWSVEHVGLADWSRLALIVPATANIIGKLAGGICDDLLSTLVCALGQGEQAACSLVLAPAMNHRMWHHPAVQANLDRLAAWGVRVVPPKSGAQACGAVGDGCLADIESIISHLGEWNLLA